MESYTLGRDIHIERVKEIYHLFRQHRLQLAGMRSSGRSVTDDDLARERCLAHDLRQSG